MLLIPGLWFVTAGVKQEQPGWGDDSCPPGQVCGTYAYDCGPQGHCVCFTTVEGDGVCIDDFFCDRPLCSRSSECGAGQVCIGPENCCGVGICALRQCTNGGPNPTGGRGTAALGGSAGAPGSP